ncbi:MAG TPA: MBL fold metallo-hydrolase [Gemmatimonadaceae bacterium]|nr:MBL fold metallo-hydrolase [Gemmatimonadaceae bacterium]
MKIHTATVGPFAENAYLVVDEPSRDAVFIDPGDEPVRLLQLIEVTKAKLTAIWLTHAHLDHIGGIAGIKRAYDVPVYMHPADAPVYAFGARSAAGYGIPFEQPDPPERALAEGDVMRVGATEFKVWHVPGHAPGHVIFLADRVMLGGDLLFAGSIGRVDLPLSDPNAMQRSLDRLESLADDIVVYPGHGPATTIGEERQSNPFLAGHARLIAR